MKLKWKKVLAGYYSSEHGTIIQSGSKWLLSVSAKAHQTRGIAYLTYSTGMEMECGSLRQAKEAAQEFMDSLPTLGVEE